MNVLMSIFFKSNQTVPLRLRTNFFHLYIDIFWFGVLNGSTLAFLSIYAARLGSSAQQIGWINALPAVVTMIAALPAGVWLQNRALQKTVFGAAIINRLFYLPLILMPFFLPASSQIIGIMLLVVFMSVPGTALNVGFNALFAEAVPEEWRGQVAGIRNAVFAIATTLVSFACGYILIHFSFPVGYQIVFGIGFLGAALSTVHLGFVKPMQNEAALLVSEPAEAPASGIRNRFQPGLLRKPFLPVLLVLWGFHLAQYLPMPIFPVFSVQVLNLTDQVISLGTALFYISMFLVSTQLSRLTRRMGSKTVTGVGVILLALYPGLMSVATGEPLYLAASFFGGAAWGMAGGAIFNYLLENVPAGNKPAHLAWYNMGANVAILIGSLLGPIIAGWVGLAPALAMFAVLRFAAGLAILRWG